MSTNGGKSSRIDQDLTSFASLRDPVMAGNDLRYLAHVETSQQCCLNVR